MSRYEYDIRRPTRRRDDDSLSVFASITACIIIVGVVAAVLYFLVRDLNQRAKMQPKTTHDSMCAVHTYNGETIRFYVMVDPDTQVQYVVNDRGGMCVREFPDAD